MNKFGCGAIG